MITVVRRIRFSAAHRLWKYEGKCDCIHGHNYVVCFHAAADKLNELGMVVDFSVLKERLGGWIEKHWDHGFICHKDDCVPQQAFAAIEGQKVFLMDDNPTAENLALYLLHEVGPRQLAGTGARLIRVALWETENCCAEVSL